jgi:hypothetical protein
MIHIMERIAYLYSMDISDVIVALRDHSFA